MAATLRNAARERLDRDELALGIILRQARTVDIAPIMKAAGFDSLFLGTNDLAMELGIPGAFGDKRIVAAYQSVVDACRAHGKFAGIGGIADRELIRRYIEMGVRLVLPGSDLSLMATAAADCTAAIRACL